MGRIGPAFAIILPLSLAYYAVLYSAIYRGLLRPEEGGPGFLRLGGDELRLLGALVLVALLYFGVILAGSILLGVISAAAGLAGGPLAGLVAVIGVLALLVGIVIFAVRFSLALPATFAERRIRVFESWRLTKGRFWPLLGAYVLAIVLSIVIGILATMIYLALAALLTGGIGSATSVFAPDYGSLGGFFTPAMGLYLLVNAAISAVTTAILLGPSAAAYRAFSGQTAD